MRRTAPRRVVRHPQPKEVQQRRPAPRARLVRPDEEELVGVGGGGRGGRRFI